MSGLSKTAYHHTKCDFFIYIFASTYFILYKYDENHFAVGVVRWLEMSCRAHLGALLDRHRRGHR